jgi:hypothetical protein
MAKVNRANDRMFESLYCTLEFIFVATIVGSEQVFAGNVNHEWTREVDRSA